jgi:hypothetical protein
MRLVWKLLLVLALAITTVFTWALTAQAPPPALPPPILSVCILLAVGWVAKSASPAFAKRFTTATGFG